MARNSVQDRPLTAAEEAHVGQLHERFKEALSREQIVENFRMSLGLPGSDGRVPAHRERLGAMKLFADLLVPRPRPEAAEAAESGVVIIRSPYDCTCRCTCGAHNK